jgi:hypothetical protein
LRRATLARRRMRRRTRRRTRRRRCKPRSNHPSTKNGYRPLHVAHSVAHVALALKYAWFACAQSAHRRPRNKRWEPQDQLTFFTCKILVPSRFFRGGVLTLRVARTTHRAGHCVNRALIAGRRRALYRTQATLGKAVEAEPPTERRRARCPAGENPRERGAKTENCSREGGPWARALELLGTALAEIT